MLSTHAKRTVVVTIRVTAMEREMIISRATKAGKSVSDYIRGAAMFYAHAQTPAQQAAGVGRQPSKFLAPSDGRGGA